MTGRNIIEARDRAIARLLKLQSPRGDWEGEMVWCAMITAQYVIVRHVTCRPLSSETRDGVLTYFRVSRTSDGAWGLHPEASGSVFVTTLVYVAMRLLGVSRDDDLAKPARDWLERQKGGVLAIPTWGKFWLALLGLYGWQGVSPCPPELVLLPRRTPLHPARYYCHTRQIYLAMAYLYGRRFVADLGTMRDTLCAELYAAPYATLDFARHRARVAAADLAVPPSRALRALQTVLAAHERVHWRRLRRRALGFCLARIVDEQRTTGYGALSPVNGLLNCLALFAADPAHPDLAPSFDGLETWRWEDHEWGVRYAGARSNTWDTAFALEALVAAHADGALARDAARRAQRFLQGAQAADELPHARDQDRDPIIGGWCFSNGHHRWPVSDCTAEAVSALLSIERMPALAAPVEERIPRDRLRSAAEFIIARQNGDGGFGTYERRRGGSWLERLNPSEMFANCMTKRSYIECTASAVVAFARLRAAGLGFPEMERADARAVALLRRAQRPDGDVPGFWGINFTYGALQFVRGLRAAGVAATDAQLQRAARWLVARQRADGGWGEHWSGCLTGRYVEHAESQVVMTSWALLALVDVLGPDADPVRRGVDWLVAQQRGDGSFPPGSVNGVFFGTAMLEYRLYSVYFPAWALARCVPEPATTPSR